MNSDSPIARLVLLRDPFDGEPVFLGVTTREPAAYLRSLRQTALKQDAPIGDYLGRLAGDPLIEVVAEIDADSYRKDRTAELRAWRARYPDLLNAVPHGL